MLLGMSGCAQWNDAQLGLLTQARKGVANVTKRDEQRAAAITELASLRRQRLDEAFDQDVRERPTLDADWVIAHRKAYAVGLDAYAQAQAAEEANELAEKRDLAAIDAALVRLQWLNSIEAKFNIFPEVSDEQH
jgi:hypothetical protein